MRRSVAYPVLLACGAALFLLNLGAPGLWDVDEGNNAEAAREMFMSGDWIVPTFNYQLRSDKPALLYWLQALAYGVFGVNEFSARLPSALAAMVTVLLAYELGRGMFGPAAGVLSGLIAASTVMIAAAAHFANPDALLNACTVAVFLLFWISVRSNDARWLVPAGAAAGLGVLAKGPVAVALPGLVGLAFLTLSRRLRLLADRRLAWAVVACLAVALPWYVGVGARTKGEFLRGFFLTHNIGRFSAAMEGHRGPLYYYLVCLVVGFAPWSAFVVPALRHAWRCQRNTLVGDDAPGRRDAIRYLALWIVVYLGFFSLSATKLPNYILPVAVPLAILTALYLADWRSGRLSMAPWEAAASIAGWLLTGVVVIVGALVAAGRLGGLKDLRTLPSVEGVALIGLVPITCGPLLAWLHRREARTAAVVCAAAGSVTFVTALAAWGAVLVDRHKAPRMLIATLLEHPAEPEIRVACYQFPRPSVVFYCRREVLQLPSDAEAADFLRYPMASYLLCPQTTWDALRAQVPAARILDAHWDLYRGAPVVLVTNR